MTARSFTEALRIGDPYADSEPIHATWCVAASFVVGEECDCPAATIKALIADRERAIRWAVTLEGQNAAALAIHEKAYGAFCLECHVAWPCPTVAALTGSTE